MTEQLPTPEIPAVKSRNYGIDALRILAMFMVTVLHVLGQGGALSASSRVSIDHYNVAWLMEIAAYGAVDIYALISGYVGVNSRSRCSKIMLLRLQTSFWALIIVAVFAFFPPVSPLAEEVTGNSWFNACFPMMTDMYWYITCYFGLLFFKPLLDAAVHHTSEKRFYIFLAAIFVFFLTLPMFKDTIKIPYMGLGGGYSLIWLIALYLIGGFFRKYDIPSKIPGQFALLAALLALLFTWIAKIELQWSQLVSYVSPTVFITSVGLFIAFSKLNVRHKVPQKIISILSPATLGVYIIHVNPFIWKNIIKDFARGIVDCPIPLMVLRVLGCAATIYISCSILDIIRGKLFDLIKLKKRLGYLDDTVEKWLAQ